VSIATPDPKQITFTALADGNGWTKDDVFIYNETLSERYRKLCYSRRAGVAPHFDYYGLHSSPDIFLELPRVIAVWEEDVTNHCDPTHPNLIHQVRGFFDFDPEHNGALRRKHPTRVELRESA
jgi:hypothetical protein